MIKVFLERLYGSHWKLLDGWRLQEALLSLCRELSGMEDGSGDGPVGGSREQQDL